MISHVFVKNLIESLSKYTLNLIDYRLWKSNEFLSIKPTLTNFLSKGNINQGLSKLRPARI